MSLCVYFCEVTMKIMVMAGGVDGCSQQRKRFAVLFLSNSLAISGQ